jgi:hypothetical protein
MSEPQVFTIAWSFPPLARHGRRVWMTAATSPVFFARPIGAVTVPCTWLITERDVPAPPDSPEVIGVLTRGRSSLLSRRWVLRCGGNEELGFVFYDPTGKRRGVRAFRVVIPRAPPYRSESPETNLSSMARAGQVDNNNFLMLGSMIPFKKPDGKVALRFGQNIILQPSVKNFIVPDAEEKHVFVIYKSSDETCLVRAMPPITPLFAFALGVAIMTTTD